MPVTKQNNPWTWVPGLYFTEAIPFMAVLTISLVLYKQLGVSNGEITFYTAWLYLPWVLKPLWSAFINRVGAKQKWIALIQLFIGAAFGGVAFTLPSTLWFQGSLFFFWIIAFSSALHHALADSLYLSEVTPDQQLSFKGIRAIAYRLGLIFGQSFLVMLAGNLQVIYRNSISYSWSLVLYAVMGIFIFLGLWHGYTLPDNDTTLHPHKETLATWRDCLRAFQPKGRPARLFLFLFLIPQGFLTATSSLFLIDSAHCGGLGLSPQEFGFVRGTMGAIGFAAGGIIGSIALRRTNLSGCLWGMAIAIALPAPAYLLLSYALPANVPLISLCVFGEQLAYGFGLTAYIRHIAGCFRLPSAIGHLSFGSSLMALNMMWTGFFSGVLQQSVGYRTFFLLITIGSLLPLAVAGLLKAHTTSAPTHHQAPR